MTSNRHDQSAQHGENIEEALMKQIEYYFSRENLASDKFLVLQMNGENYVPIETICTFNQVKVLLGGNEIDIPHIANIMKKSKAVEVDPNGQMIRPKIPRNTLILRDIPSTTDTEEVKKLFSNELKAKITNVRPDIGDTWFISFEEEEFTLKSFDYIRNQKFNDKPIKARIKSETVIRRTYNSPNGVSFVGGYNNNNNNDSVVTDGMQVNAPVYNPQNLGRSYPSNWDQYYDPNVPQNFDKDRSRGYKSKRGGATSFMDGNQQVNSAPDKKNRSRNRKQNGDKSSVTINNNTPQVLPLGPQHFPPLPTRKANKGGYSAEFTKYSSQEILEIINIPEDSPTKHNNVPHNNNVNVDGAKSPNAQMENTKPSQNFDIADTVKVSHDTSRGDSDTESAPSLEDADNNQFGQQQLSASNTSKAIKWEKKEGHESHLLSSAEVKNSTSNNNLSYAQKVKKR